MQMNDQTGRLLRDLTISLVSSGIFGLGAKIMTTVVIPPRFATAPTWLLVTTTLTGAVVAFLVARRVNRGRAQVFVLISAFTQTRFLAGLLQDLSRTLDRHGIDMVVRLPQHDHSGRIRSRQLAALQKGSHGWVGAFLAVTEPVDDGGELAELGRQVRSASVRPIAAMRPWTRFSAPTMKWPWARSTRAWSMAGPAIGIATSPSWALTASPRRRRR